MIWWEKPCFYFILSPDDLREESGGDIASPRKRDGHKRSQMVRKRIICWADVLQPIKQLMHDMLNLLFYVVWESNLEYTSMEHWSSNCSVTVFMHAVGSHEVNVSLLRKGWYWSRKFSSTRRYQKNVKKPIWHFGCGKKKNKNKNSPQINQHIPLHLEEWSWFLQVPSFCGSSILAKCTQCKY